MQKDFEESAMKIETPKAQIEQGAQALPNTLADKDQRRQLGFFSRLLAPIFLTENEIENIKTSK